MDKGLVTNPKDLAHMQQELVSLARRIGELEDTELEVMERLEAGAGRARSGWTPGWPRSTTWRPTLVASRDKQAGEVTELAATATPGAQGDRRGRARRTCSRSTSGSAPRRAASGPRSCAHRRCSGCSLELTAADLGAIAKAPTRRGAALRGVRPDPGADRRVRDLMAGHRAVAGSRRTAARAATPARRRTARCCSTRTPAR